MIHARRMTRSQGGFSLIELSVALLVLGLIAIALVAYLRSATQQQRTLAERDLLADAERALVGFAHAGYRLPCPATDQAGLEDCTGGAQLGWLPWRTLGLPHATAGTLRYAVRRVPNVATPFDDQDLAVARDRLVPAFTIGNPPVMPGPLLANMLGNANLLDLCYALDAAARTPLAGTPVGVVNAAGAVRTPVAFMLAAPGALDSDGDGDPFDGRQRTATAADPAFDLPGRARIATYDDRVLALGFTPLFDQLGCAAGLSAISHSHVNAATAAAFMRKALIDYKRQLQIAEMLADAGVAAGAAGILSAAAGVSAAVADSANATAFTILTYGAAGAVIAPAVAAIVTNTLAIASAAFSMAKAVAMYDEAKRRVVEVQPLVDDSAALWTSIDANARTADALGF